MLPDFIPHKLVTNDAKYHKSKPVGLGSRISRPTRKKGAELICCYILCPINYIKVKLVGQGQMMVLNRPTRIAKQRIGLITICHDKPVSPSVVMISVFLIE